MDASQGKDNPVIDIETVSRGEQLKDWIERGFSEQAVAVYGTSAGNFRKILKSRGILPSQVDLLDSGPQYRKELVKSGGQLYYCLPFYDALRKERPELYQRMSRNLENSQMHLNIPNQTRSATIYANYAAFTEEFLKRTGVDILLRDLPIDQLNSLVNGWEIAEEYRVEIDKLDKELREKGIDPKEAVLEAGRRKGVLVYLNNRIFMGTQVDTTPEDERELVIVSDRLLTTDIISGIKFLSDEEEKEVRQEYGI